MRWGDRHTLTLGRVWMAWGVLLVSLLLVRSCLSLKPALVHAAPSAEHPCHLLDKAEWTAEGYVEHGGLKGADLVFLFRLTDGCTCILYIPVWLEDPSTFPRHQAVVLHGITLQEHANAKPFAVVLGVGSAT